MRACVGRDGTKTVDLRGATISARLLCFWQRDVASLAVFLFSSEGAFREGDFRVGLIGLCWICFVVCQPY